MGELAVMDRTGDTKTIWDPDNQAETDAAREQFDKLRKAGHLAYTVDEKGKKGTQIHKFDPKAGKIILAPPLRGG
jgi:hypothetical protein